MYLLGISISTFEQCLFGLFAYLLNGINFSKEIKDPPLQWNLQNTEKIIKEGPRKQRLLPHVYRSNDIIFVKYTLPRVTCIVSVRPNKILMLFYRHIDNDPKISEEHKRLWIAEKSWAERTKLEGVLTMNDFKIHYRATVTNIVWYWYNHRCGDQQNRTGIHRGAHTSAASWVFTKVPKTSTEGKKMRFLINVPGKTVYHHEEDWNLTPVTHNVQTTNGSKV